MRTNLAYLIEGRALCVGHDSALARELARLARGAEVDIDVDEAIGGAARAASFRERLGGVIAGNVQVIPVRNMITPHFTFLTWMLDGTAVDWLLAAIREAVGDPAVSSIVLQIDSPGGYALGMTEAAAELRALAAQKPIVALIEEAASAAYYIAAQAGEVVLTPSGMAGSVGVVIMHVDQSRALDEAGYTVTLVHSGEFKVEGNPYEPLDEEALARFQTESDHYYGLFLGDVAKGRGISAGQVRDSFGQGRMLLPEEAMAVGMVDRVESLDATIRRLNRIRAATPKGAGAIGTVEIAVPMSGAVDATAFSQALSDAIAEGLREQADVVAEAADQVAAILRAAEAPATSVEPADAPVPVSEEPAEPISQRDRAQAAAAARRLFDQQVHQHQKGFN